MKYDISKFEELVNQGYLRKSETDSLILFGYTDQCTFDKHWNEYTMLARGLILEKSTGTVVAKCLPKFFNLNETPDTLLSALPIDSPYEVFEKVDGSLAIIFYYQNEWHVATRGSFYSDQAVKAKELLKKYDLRRIGVNVTILAEIIYPSNKIIVDYGNQEKLVMLAAFERENVIEFSSSACQTFAERMGMEFATQYDYTIAQMIELQKTLPKDQEGFVVRFENNLRVKIKGNEYLRIAKLIAHLSPISLWETMDNGKVNTMYLTQLPEEFRKDFEPIVASLEKQYDQVVAEINKDLKELPTREITPEGKKSVGIFLKDTNKIKHKSAMFPSLLGEKNHVNSYIMKQIRPDGNVLRVL